MTLRIPAIDPRYYQLAVLGLLVTTGITVLDFGIRPLDVLVIALVAQAVQWTGTRLVGGHFDPRSALVTTLSLILLLRSDSTALLALAALLAIGSKFVLRVNGKHVWNPANFAIVSLMLASDHAWISSGQWGNAALGAFALGCLGFLVLTRARRAETTLSFLGGYALLLAGRTWWLGDPWSIPLHHLQNGALLIFAFFMISDPKTTPDSALGRVLFGAIVALTAYIWQFAYYQPFGPLLALYFLAPLVPCIDFLLRGRCYDWRRPDGNPPVSATGVTP